MPRAKPATRKAAGAATGKQGSAKRIKREDGKGGGKPAPEYWEAICGAGKGEQRAARRQSAALEALQAGAIALAGARAERPSSCCSS